MRRPGAFDIARKWREWWKEPPRGRGGSREALRALFLFLVGLILGLFLRDVIGVLLKGGP